MLGLAHRRKQSVPLDSGSPETNIGLIAGGPLSVSNGSLKITAWWNKIYKLMGYKALSAPSSDKTIDHLSSVYDDCLWKGKDPRLPYPFQERAGSNRFEPMHLDALPNGRTASVIALSYLPPVGGLKRVSGVNLYNVLGMVKSKDLKAKDLTGAYTEGGRYVKSEVIEGLSRELYTNRVSLPSRKQGIRMVILPNKGEIAHGSAPHVYKEGADEKLSSKPFFRLML